MVKKRKKKSRKKNQYNPRPKRKIKTHTNPKIREGGYIWIGFIIVLFVLNYFSAAAAAIFGGIILFSIIKRGWY